MDESEHLPLPGLDVVGRGLYLRPHHPYELKALLFRQGDHRTVYSREADKTYALPRGYEVNESPPAPPGVALNQVSLEESWERFAKSRAVDYGLAAGRLVFCVNASAHVGEELRSEQESFYGARSSFVAMWSVYLEDPSEPSEALDVSGLPVPFTPEHRRIYEAFFERYGTHFVKRAWVGGKAEVLFSVAKSTSLSKEDIHSGLKATVGFEGGDVGRKRQQSKELLQSQSQCTVLGRGGDELKLAALSSLDEAAYNAWLATIKTNPQTVELGIAGIWTLVDEADKSRALMDAYKAAATFTPISSVFCIDDTVHFTRGRTFFTYEVETRQSTRPRALGQQWPELDGLGFERIDAAFAYDGLIMGEVLGRKLFLFRDDQLLRLDVDTKAVDPGYPRKIAQEWPGVEFDRIDAAMSINHDAVYFFCGNKYARFNAAQGRVDEGYPELIQRRWLGLSFERIDAAIHWSDGKVYFFRDDQYIRYDTVTLRADPEYPKPITGSYVEDWNFFD